jgi:hypothetical protein
MKNRLSLLVAFVAVLAQACGPPGGGTDSDAEPAGAAAGTDRTGERMAMQEARPQGRPWDRVVQEENLRTLDPAVFDVAVTVRTGRGETVRVFGRPISTNFEQVVIHGHGESSRELGRQLGIPESPFWVRADLDTSLPPRLRELESRLGPLLRQGLVDVPSAMDSIAVLVDQRSGPLAILFPVNGIAVEVPLWTGHEGSLERIHIDAPIGRIGDEVTVIGYYSRSASPTAIELPKKVCRWCGDVEICVPGATC